MPNLEPTGPIPTPAPTGPIPSPAPQITPNQTAKTKKPFPRAVIVGLIALAVLAAIAIPLTISRMRASAYEEAMSLYDAEQYQEAAEAFEALGDYQDSSAMMQTAQLGATAQSQEKRAGEDPAAWEATAQAWEQMGTSRGRQHAETCRNNATYYTGTQLMSDGSWAEARETFASLEGAGFSDVPDLIAECDAHLSYNDAVALMSNGSWAEAREALAELDGTGFFEDIPSLLAECDAHIAYDAAEALYSEGSYYDAYVAFNDLAGVSYEGIPDCSERAQACIQDYPGNGTVYSNPDYSSTAVPLTIRNDSTYAFVKFYIGEDLVRTVFISPDGSATVYMPAGTYTMNEAHGDLWFGESDMFGDDGTYYHCIVGGSETFDLEYGYSYEISPGNGGTGIGTQPISRDSF